MAQICYQINPIMFSFNISYCSTKNSKIPKRSEASLFYANSIPFIHKLILYIVHW
jgi:hypothetical protein